MADPIQNAQFLSALFARPVQDYAQGNAQKVALAQMDANQRRQDSLMFWKREQEMSDDKMKADLSRELKQREIDANLQGQKNQTDRILGEMKLREEQSIDNAARSLYAKYGQLSDPTSKKEFTSFGESPQERFQNLSNEVGNLEQSNLISPEVRAMYREYSELGGTDKVESFGRTPAEQYQSIGRELSILKRTKARTAFGNIENQINEHDAKIEKAEQLTPEEVAQARSIGLRELGKDAAEYYTQLRKQKFSEQGAMQEVEKRFPLDAGAVQQRSAEVASALKAQKRDKDRSLRKLYDDRSMMEQRRIGAAMKLDELGETSVSPTQEAGIPPALGRVSLQSIIKNPAVNAAPPPMQNALRLPTGYNTFADPSATPAPVIDQTAPSVPRPAPFLPYIGEPIGQVDDGARRQKAILEAIGGGIDSFKSLFPTVSSGSAQGGAPLIFSYPSGPAQVPTQVPPGSHSAIFGGQPTIITPRK